MVTEFHLKTSELNVEFIERIKGLFGDKSISIVIEEEMDDTEYLLANEENKHFLNESIEQYKSGETIQVDFRNDK
jgi:hypothetical protein